MKHTILCLVTLAFSLPAAARVVKFQPTDANSKPDGEAIYCNARDVWNGIVISPLKGTFGSGGVSMKLNWKGCGTNGFIVGENEKHIILSNPVAAAKPTAVTQTAELQPAYNDNGASVGASR